MTMAGGDGTGHGQNDFAPSAEQVSLLKAKAKFCRLETIRLIEIAKTGHYTSVFSAAELFAALYYDVMALKSGEPKWPGRDRFLMGKGHAAVGQFPILADLGFIPKEWLDSYTRLGSPLGDHPDMRKVPGIDFSSGSIGHALSGGLGMCLAGRITGQRYTVFVMLGDGEMQEGQVWEAALSAAAHKAGNLIAIVDRNGFQLDGKVDDVIGIEPLDEKWRAFGWETHLVDGHNVSAVTEASTPPQGRPGPDSARLRDRQDGQGQGRVLHGDRAGLAPGLPRSRRREARDRRNRNGGDLTMTGPLSPNSWQYRGLNALNPGLSYLSDGLIGLVEAGHPVVAGSADLQYSNGLNKFAAAYPDRYIQFGISEQNMVTAAAGMATCGLVPFVATFASFLGLLCCEQIRMDVAYSAQPVRLIGHHTGISLGFYGTSHHATEDIGTMRSIADLDIVSPCDGPQLVAAIKASATRDRPIYFRISRGRDPVVYESDAPFRLRQRHRTWRRRRSDYLCLRGAGPSSAGGSTQAQRERPVGRRSRYGVDQAA